MKSIMRKAAPPVVVVVALLLAGCTAPSATATSEPTQSIATTATPTPTPSTSTMSIASAGDYFLATVCPSNDELGKFQTAVNAGADIDLVHSTAASLIGSYQESARRLDDTSITWPSTVTAADVATLRDSYLGLIGPLNAVSTASDFTAINSVAWPDQTGVSAASQRIRLRLDLSADNTASCAQWAANR